MLVLKDVTGSHSSKQERSLGKFWKPKFLSKISRKKKGIVKELQAVLKSIKKIEKLQKESEQDVESRDLSEWKDEVIESLLTKIFISLKNSELLEPVIRFSLTDDKTRQGLIDTTIELLKADVIPWYDIFVALKDSGLAIDVIKFLLTDPETRQGEVDLILELIPRLIEEKVIRPEDILKHLPKPEFGTDTTHSLAFQPR